MSYSASMSRRSGFVTAMTVVAATFLVAPLLIVFIQSLTAEDYLRFPPRQFGWRWYGFVLTDPDWQRALTTSILVAVVVTPLSVALGTAAVLGLDRLVPTLRKVLKTALVSPMILPHVVLGMAIYRVFLATRFDDTVVGFTIAHLVLSVPYVIVTVGASLQTFDRTLQEAAESLGASFGTVVFRIILPLLRPGLIGGAIFAFITSFDEFIVTYFLASRRTTAPLQIFSSLSYQLEPSIAAVSGLTLILTAMLSGLLVLHGGVGGQSRVT